LVQSVAAWNYSFVAGIVGVRFLFEALVAAERGDLALELAGRDVSACDSTLASCTFSQQLAEGPGTLWENWDDSPAARSQATSQLWTGSSLNHIMFGGGPGLFIYHAAGLTAAAWTSTAAEVVFELDAKVAAAVGGADVWTETASGEASLRWRLEDPCGEETLASVNISSLNNTHGEREWCIDACAPGAPLLVVEVVGMVPRALRDSWRVHVPLQLLLVNRDGDAARSVALSDPDGVVATVTADHVTLRPLGGVHHAFGVCEQRVTFRGTLHFD